MRYQELVESVRDSVPLDTAEDARDAVDAVLATVAHCVTPDMREHLAERLPSALRQAVEVPGETEIRDGDALIIEIGRRTGTDAERARYLGQAVFESMRSLDPDLVGELRGELHSNLLQVLAPVGEPPDLARNRVDPTVRTKLSDTDVTNALRQLPQWTGDRHGIRRTVSLPSDRHPPLINGVQTAARHNNDHVHVHESGDDVTFTLRTGREGVVTEPDLDLAWRIDRVVAEVGSGGKPGP